MPDPPDPGSDRLDLDDLLDDEEVFETPADPFDRLVLNPGADTEESTNPLCPVCEEPIRPHANQYQRAFVCGCDETRRFEFGEDDGLRADGGVDQSGVDQPTMLCPNCHSEQPVGPWACSDCGHPLYDDGLRADGGVGEEREVEDLEPQCPECESGRLVYYRNIAGWLCSFVECSNRVFRESEIRSLVDDDPRADDGVPQSTDELPGHVVRHKETGERYVVKKVEDGEIFVQSIDDENCAVGTGDDRNG